MSKLSIPERVQLVLARIEIQKLKASNGGYDWAMLSRDVVDMLEETLGEIEGLLKL